jgi:hypothetical protein
MMQECIKQKIHERLFFGYGLLGSKEILTAKGRVNKTPFLAEALT